MPAGPRLIWLVFGALLALSACTGQSVAGGEDQSTTSDPGTTSTAAPIILALAPNLGLGTDQCFADLPLAETTTTTEAPQVTADDVEGDETTQTTQDAIDQQLETTTTLPRPPTVAVVDCSGTNLGQVYAAFCLGVGEDDSTALTAVACPGEKNLDYPGDRAIRRAAARVCLQRFEEVFGEDYAASSRVAQEFTPTEGVWELGDHRVVCSSVTDG